MSFREAEQQRVKIDKLRTGLKDGWHECAEKTASYSQTALANHTSQSETLGHATESNSNT